MAKKSNKTAHVLNLISPVKSEEPSPQEEEVRAAESAPKKAETTPQEASGTQTETPVSETPASQSETHPSVSDVSAETEPPETPAPKPEAERSAKAESIRDVLHLSDNTETLSDLIKDNLEKEFAAALQAELPEQASEPAPQAAAPMPFQQESEPFTIDPEPITSEQWTTAPEQDTETVEMQAENLPQEQTATDTEIPVDISQDTTHTEESEDISAPSLEELLTENIAATLSAQEEHAEPVPAAAEPEPIPEPSQKPIAAEPEPVPEPTQNPIAAEPEPAPEPMQESVVLKPEPIPEPIPQSEPIPLAQPISESDSGLKCINVYEQLVVQMAPEYIAKFGSCDCAHCHLDVIALALTNLPAKYIVSNSTEATLMMDFYGRKYRSQVIAELVRACLTVQKNPHH